MSQTESSVRKNIILVVSILGISLLVVVLLVFLKPVAEHKAVIVKAPRVEVVKLHQQQVQIPVYSRGVLEAEKQITLATEVSGKIVWLSKKFKDAGEFRQGDLLLKIDNRDYKLAVIRAQAQVAAALQILKRVEAEAEQAKKDLRRLSSTALKNASPYALREPQLKEAQAKLKAARADLSLAELKLEKTDIYAPFNGRLLNKHVDLGQYVVSGSSLADIYHAGALQVALPVSLEQLELLLPEKVLTDEKPVQVLLSENLAHKNIHWPARVTQLDSKVDIETQLVKLIARLDMESIRDNKNILLPGLFVQAKIISPEKYSLYVIPRQALHANNELWLLNKNSQLTKLRVTVLYKNDKNIFIQGYLQDGQKVILSAIDSPVSGMQLEEAEQ